MSALWDRVVSLWDSFWSTDSRGKNEHGSLADISVNSLPNAYGSSLRRQQSLEVAFGLDTPFEDLIISEELRVEAMAILCKTANLYESSRYNTEKIQGMRYPLYAGRLLVNLATYAPGTGQYEVLRGCLRYIYDVPRPMSSMEVILAKCRPGCEALEANPNMADCVYRQMFSFAEHLVNSFLVPLLAEGGKTGPAPTRLVTPHGSAIPIESVRGRLASFRASVMSREAGCCAITGAMDMSAVDKLLEGDPNMDEELMGDTTYCEAAHILPHGNSQAEANGSLSESKKYFWTLLSMFAPQLGSLVLGIEVDKPHNGIFLSKDRHADFGTFKLWFEETADKDSYVLCKAKRHILPRAIRRKVGTIITFHDNSEGGIDLPHPMLLRIHAALAKVIEASEAGEHVQQILRDAKEITALSEDTPTDLTSFFATRGLVEVV